jgi:hypothetical protein
VKDVVGLILNAGNVDRHQILGDLLPSNRSSAAGAHVKHFSPQPLNTTQPTKNTIHHVHTHKHKGEAEM